MSRALVVFSSFAPCMALAVALSAQAPVWGELPSVDGVAPSLGQSVYDTARQRLVAVTSADVIECDRTSFRRTGPGTNLTFAAVAYDSARHRTVTFGGSLVIFADGSTRAWDGATWTVLTPPTSPPARHHAAMAYDRIRDRVVLFGGRDQANVDLADTWEFDGTTWTLVATVGPTARNRHLMTYDPVRAVTVLFGGDAGVGGWSSHTWEWDGVAWTQHAAGPAAPPGVLAYDESRGRCVLLANSAPASTSSTYERVGTNWVLAEPVSPMQVALVGGAFDAVLGRVVTAAPDAAGLGATPLWSWDGSTWARVVRNEVAPPADGAAVAPCGLRQSTLRYGSAQSATLGSGATYEWLAGEWRVVPTATQPPLLTDVALAAEPGGTVVMFGGRTTGAVQAATWRFTGTDWQLLQPASAPSPRSQHGMAFDSLRNRVVLFGGEDGGGLLGDTWEWDGATWVQRAPAQSPSPRANPAMAFDAASGTTLLFGGAQRFGAAQADFWRWDGTNWQPIVAPGAPAARGRAQFAFDPLRQRAVLAGGFANQFLGLAPVSGTYEWDGAGWTAIGGTQPPSALGALGSFDANAGRFVLHTTAFVTAVDWQVGAPTLANVVGIGSACGGAAGEPVIAAPTLPKTGNPWFALRVGSLLPGALTLLGVDSTPAAVPLGSGCTLRVAAPQLVAGVADAAGVMRFAVPLPNAPALHGATFHCQGLGIDPNGAFAGLAVFTAGLTVTID